MSQSSHSVFDTLVIGGGPGGLTGAIYLRRFTRKVALVDKGHSRLGWIPVSHNYPGFPEGVHGAALLEALRGQLANCGGSVTPGEVLALRLEDGIFVADVEPGGGAPPCQLRAHTVLLASGVADGGMPVERWNEAVARGAVRLCPVCDGYDVLDKRIAVATTDTNPVAHALFMRSFSADVTLFERNDESALSDEDRRRLDAARVRYVDSPLAGVSMSDALKPVLHTRDGHDFACDVFYPMLGETARSDLARGLGARTGDGDKLVVDDHQRTTVPGLFAVGDVVLGLNQIAVATGQAAVAATAIHNALPPALRP